MTPRVSNLATKPQVEAASSVGHLSDSHSVKFNNWTFNGNFSELHLNFTNDAASVPYTTPDSDTLTQTTELRCNSIMMISHPQLEVTADGWIPATIALPHRHPIIDAPEPCPNRGIGADPQAVYHLDGIQWSSTFPMNTVRHRQLGSTLAIHLNDLFVRCTAAHRTQLEVLVRNIDVEHCSGICSGDAG